MRSRSFIDSILALPALGRALLSPDGTRVAWTWYRKAPAADVYVAASDGAGAPERLTPHPNPLPQGERGLTARLSTLSPCGRGRDPLRSSGRVRGKPATRSNARTRTPR